MRSIAESIYVSLPREKKFQKADSFVMASLAYAEQPQVIAHTGFRWPAVRIRSIIRKLLYGVFGVVVIPGHAIMVDESKQLVLIFNQPRSESNSLSFAKTRSICIFNSLPCHSSHQYLPDQNSISA